MRDDSLNNLTESQFITKMDALIGEIIESDLKSEALELVSTINQIFEKQKKFKQLYPEVYDKYKDYLIKAKFIALPFLEKEDILHLLEFHFKTTYKLPFYNLYRKLREKLLSFDDLDERDNLKKRIKDALFKNQEKITSNVLNIGGVAHKPTTGGWIKDYLSIMGVNPVGKLKQSQYLINSQNIKSLSSEEKERIKILLSLYERLKLSSVTAEGLEENFVAILPSGEISLVSGGVVEKINPEIIKITNKINLFRKEVEKKEEEKKINQSDETAGRYGESCLEEKAVKEEKERENKIDELAGMASRFPVGSLERKAVEEELRKYR